MVRRTRTQIRGQSYYSRLNKLARRAYTSKVIGRFARLGRFAAFGPLALAAAGAANFFAKVPDMPRGWDVGEPSGKRAKKDDARDVTPYIQLSRVNRTSGKKLSKKGLTQKLVSSVAQPLVTRMQNLSLMSAVNGKNFLNYAPAAANLGDSVFPVYAFDLTGSVNSPSAGVTVRYPMVMYRLHRTRDTTVPTDVGNPFVWKTVNCSQGDRPDATGSKVYSWLVERKPKINVYPVAKTFFEWFDIRLMMFGAQTKPSRITVQLCHMPVGYGPRGNYTDNFSSDTSALLYEDEILPEEKQREVNQFWMGHTDTLCGNPLNKRDAYNNNRGIKVLESQTFDINPTSSTESDTRGHMKMYKLFKRYNRIINYQYERKATLATDVLDTSTGYTYDKEANPNAWDSEGWGYTTGDGAVRVNTYAGARLYLLVSAASPTSGAGNAADHASFDFAIRRKQSVVVN